MDGQETRVRPIPPAGTLAAVVGPSGAGKDSLISLAMAHFADRPDVHFVKRIITRDKDAGSEDHTGVSAEEFEIMRLEGSFAVHWDAHGLRYGIPASVNEKLALGHLVIANGSRSALHLFSMAFQKLMVINVTARPEVLAKRLELRGRESSEDIQRRLERSSLGVTGDFNTVTIDNSGLLADAGARMIALLEGVLCESRARPQ